MRIIIYIWLGAVGFGSSIKDQAIGKSRISKSVARYKVKLRFFPESG